MIEVSVSARDLDTSAPAPAGSAPVLVQVGFTPVPAPAGFSPAPADPGPLIAAAGPALIHEQLAVAPAAPHVEATVTLVKATEAIKP